MTDCSIRAENLSKQYRIGRGGPAYRTLRDTITNSIAQPLRRAGDALRRLRGQAYRDDGTVWAVKDVSFEVKQGEVVGIVGCNGAGKSTLLKILSRITEPTSGYADVRGRVGSLLEVGAGFHQELTGRVVQKDNAASSSEHSTHVAGTMMAKGVNPLAKGMSFGLKKLMAYDFSNDASEMAAAANDLLVSNHSYGAITGWL